MKRTITIDIDKVIDLLIKLGICVEVPQENEAEAVNGPSDGVYTAPAADPEIAKPIAKPEPDIKDIPLEDIRKKIVVLCAAGKKAEARDIVQEYAETVSDLTKAEQRAAVWAKLTALEG